MKRRDFIKNTILTTGVLACSPLARILAEPAQMKYASDIVTLGATGIKASRLAMGTGTNGWGRRSNQTEELGIGGLADLLVAAYEQGINFWDSADQYGSHPHIKEALKRVPREKIVILTKTEATSEEEMKSDLDRFRAELGTDYIDIILLHAMTASDWPDEKKGAMDVLSRAREAGIIRAHGVSCHTFRALKAASDSEWVQIDLARINQEGVFMDDDVKEVLGKMHRSGKGVVGMKIFGAGRLTDRVDECLGHVLGLDYVDAFTIGQESREQMLDLVRRIPEASVRNNHETEQDSQ